MKYYRFKTFTTSYFFPKLNKDQQYMYGLYSPYGGRLSRLYWTLFKKCSIVSALTSVSEEALPFPFKEIMNADETDSLMAFNMGSPGVEQKISILGYDKQARQPFFAKYSQKERAIELTQHEAMIYQELERTGLTPRLLKLKKVDGGVYMKVEYLEGKRPESKLLNKKYIEIAIKLGNYHLKTTSDNTTNLKTCLSHGDFCPWNFLVNGGEYKLIDWEMAEERPMGYDVFTFICNVSTLFHPQASLKQTIDDNRELINMYFSHFDIENWLPYLKYYAKDKSEYENKKGFKERADLIKMLENYEINK